MINSRWTVDYKKVEEKSRSFLKTIMGDEKFDKLQKDGKIEIEVSNKSDEKTIYELHLDGKLINKTKNQNYCIVADRSDYPTNDMVAIKYAWLTHRSDIAEKVANKTDLLTRITQRREPTTHGYSDFVREMEQRGWSRQTVEIDNSGAPWYGEYVDYLCESSWHRELITIDELNTNIASVDSIRKGNTRCIIDVVCPNNSKMSIMGRHQAPRGSDFGRLAYSLGLHITDENGEEIPDDTKIRIAKYKHLLDVIQLARIYYSDIKIDNGRATFSFLQGIELNSEDHLRVYIVDSQCNIPNENIKFEIETDLWTRVS